jgi:hypothetical protein
MHLLALLTTLLAPINSGIKLLLLTALAFYSYYTFGQTSGKRGRRIIKATLTPYGRARMVMGDGRRHTARIRQDSLVTPWLVIVRFDLMAGGLPVSLLLTPETVTDEQLRQLRVLLRFSQVKTVSDYP